MKGKWDDWKIFALDANLGDAVMVKRLKFWVCSFLNSFDFEIWDPCASLAYVIKERIHS